MAQRTLDEILVDLRERVGHLERRGGKNGRGGSGGSLGFRGTTAERDAQFPPPTDDVGRSRLANSQVWWFNTDKGWIESYFTTHGRAGLRVTGLLAMAPSGWYPLRGSMILGHKGMDFLNGTTQSPTGTVGYYTEVCQVLIGGVTNHDVYAMVVPIAGFYRIRSSVHNWRESETLNIMLWLNVNNVKLAAYGEGDVVRLGQ